jgi:SAM-dependent methyltransferase
MATGTSGQQPQAVSQVFFAREYWRSHGVMKFVRRYTPFWWRRMMRAPYLMALDGMDMALGRRNPLVPPRYLNYAGFRGYLEAGQEHLRYFKEFGGLQPHHRVLDLGCGIGRMAVPLTGYLTSGSYEGLDIVPSGIRWCQKHITSRFPRFHFQIADIHNKQYNPKGKFKPSEYRFPFRDNEFDFVFLISLFSHLLPDDMEHYIAEISRVLKPSGKCLITMFLLDDEARRGVAASKSSLQFVYELSGCWTTDPVTPETAVAYDETAIAPMMRRHSLVTDPIQLGGWSGRSDYFTYADIVTATKTAVQAAKTA